MPRIDLCVPFDEKDEARRLGARWDPRRKAWFVPDGVDAHLLQRWIPVSGHINVRAWRYLILKAPRVCRRCQTPTAVFAFALPPGHQTLESDDDAGEHCRWQENDFGALPHYIEFLADGVRKRIQALTPCLRLDFSKTTSSWYWMNHCEHCDMKQGDFELFCEPEVAFMPVTAESAAAIQVAHVPEPFEASAGGHVLDPEFLDDWWP